MESSFEENEKICSNICQVLQIIGSKWSFPVIAELAQGPIRYNQLQKKIEIIRPQSLTNTLRQLEQNGFVHRQVFPTIPVTVEYSLTEKGEDFQNVLKEMDKWALKWVGNNE
ncbi:winged helix-turn-helix transcriptional regulator [Bacillus capparidis]|uniref:DNA-binding HxlR family transcriptional regulator n=1 Tax=Bacillus capparidis TaxID=1840411 RepID=A0ABS4CXT2_9BACI|nr:helix-turn-helix domain-containing protein [Bacillus capparidis]MBP1082173.1 DNA-binding HxlR family transcriptional regulator [Bacillus capparidis]MED1096787.1 helix-turn-helix domain-containing protein [Bacillus capparidis]